MDVVLNKLGNQPDLKSIDGLSDAVQSAKTTVQTPSCQCPAFMKRQKCLECFAISLASGRANFTAIAFEGLQLILRDHQSLGSEHGTVEGQQRAEQLITMLMAIPSWADHRTVQCHALTVLVQLISSTEIPLKLNEVLNALEICKQTFDTTETDASTCVRPAARAALTQMLNSYVQNRLASLTDDGNGDGNGGRECVEIGALMDVTELLRELVVRMGAGAMEKLLVDRQEKRRKTKMNSVAGGGDSKNEKPPQPLLLPLDALFSVLSALDASLVERHLPLLNILKSELLPVIICHLHGSGKGAPAAESDVCINSSNSKQRIGSLLRRAQRALSTDSSGMATTQSAPIALDGAESARSFYQVVEQLLRLFTPLALVQPKPVSSSEGGLLLLLEELWRSALLAPPIAKRAEAIRLAKRLCINTNPATAFFGQFLQLNAAAGTDSFWLLLIECLEECCCAVAAVNSNNSNNTGAAAFSNPEAYKLSLDALRCLGALFLAISQFLSSQSARDFPEEFYARLHRLESIDIMEMEGENNSQKAERRRFSSIVPPPVDAAQELAISAFYAAFHDKLPKWRACETALELDLRLQEFALATSALLNELLSAEEETRQATKATKGGVRRKSGASTPEDSEEEEEEEKEEKCNGNGSGGKEQQRLMTPLDVYALTNAVILALERRAEHVPEWIRARTTAVGDAANVTAQFGQIADGGQLLAANNNVNANDEVFLMRALQSMCQCRHPFAMAIVRRQPLSEIATTDIPPNANRLLHLFGPDPLYEPSGILCHKQQQQRHNDNNGDDDQFLLLSRWLRLRIENCSSSIVRMLTQFPIRVKGTSEAAKFATIETIASLVGLAAQIGMPTKLHWAFEYIGEQICVLEELREAVRRCSANKQNSEDAKPARRFCGRPEILAIQSVMENALSALVILPAVAKHVIRCVQFVWELERWHFKLAKSTIDAIYEPPSLPVPPTRSGQNSPIGQLVDSTLGEHTSTEFARLMDQFLAVIDRLFHDAPTILPVDSFCALLNAIANANEDNLCYSGGMAPIETCAQLMQRLCQLLCAKGPSTPLSVKLVCWHRVREHYILCASSNAVPPEICRRTLDGVQEVLLAMLHWEWGGPAPPRDRYRLAIVHGWNAHLFAVFPAIFERQANNEGETSIECSIENANQIGQILLAFMYQQHVEHIGSGWPALWRTVKHLAQRGIESNGNGSSKIHQQQMPSTMMQSPTAMFSTNANSISALAISIFEKFLSMKQLNVMMANFEDFIDVLAHSITLACNNHYRGMEEQKATETNAENGQEEKEQQQQQNGLFDRLFRVLEQCERVATDCLLGSVVPLSELPNGIGEAADARLALEWKEFLMSEEGGKSDHGGRGGEGSIRTKEEEEEMAEDYLELLADLKTEISEQMAALMIDDKGNAASSVGDFSDRCSNPIHSSSSLPPWHHLAVATDRIVAADVLCMLRSLMDILLPKKSFPTCCSTADIIAKRARLALNIADLVNRIALEFGPNFGIFCLCAIVLPQFHCAIRSPLTNASARALKQFIGIACAQISINELLKGNNSNDDEVEVERAKAAEEVAASKQWQLLLMARFARLAVRCVAKGGTLSLAGCALLRRLCAIADIADSNEEAISNQMAFHCANSIWLASRYALFPIRMLIAQFFVNSTDFSGDLDQMKVSYRLGLNPTEVEERVDNVQQLANQIFCLEDQCQMQQREETAAGVEEERHGLERMDSVGSATDGGGGGGPHFPSKFAYLFLFDCNKHANRGGGGARRGSNGKKLSMGLDELMDSLMCQLLLVQLTSEQLAKQWTERGGGDGDKTASKRSRMQCCCRPLLAVLNATLAICEQFEQRPGLKSLLQKLTGLPSPANLWTLSLTATHALCQFEVDQLEKQEAEAKEGDTEWKEKHLKRIANLVEQTAAREGSGRPRRNTETTNVKSNNSAGKFTPNGERGGGGDKPIKRTNPFMRTQQSRSSVDGGERSGEARRCEAAKVRSLAFGRLLSLMERTLLNGEGSIGNQRREEVCMLLANNLREMLANWVKQMEAQKAENLEEEKKRVEEAEHLNGLLREFVDKIAP